MKSDPKLKWWYGYYNRAYFAGELPANTVVCWAQELVGTKYDADHTPADDGTPHIIRVSLEIKERPKHLRFSLLHEMVHLKLDEEGKEDNSTHGRLFCREMLNLAKLGAFDRLW